MSCLLTSNCFTLSLYILYVTQFGNSSAIFAPNPEKQCLEKDVLLIFERLDEVQSRTERAVSAVERRLTEEMEQLRAEVNEQFTNFDDKLAKLIKFAGGIIEEESFISEECLECLCRIEQSTSICRVPSPTCLDNTDLYYCGPYNIDEIAWTDAAAENPDLQDVGFRECTSTLECSNKVMNSYMSKYAKEDILGHVPTCEDISRIHKGGPNGYKERWTLTYASQVTDCLSSLN